MSRDAEEEIRRTIDEAEELGPGATSAQGQKGRERTDAGNSNAGRPNNAKEPPRPIIKIEPGKLSAMATAAEERLIAAKVEFFQRSSMLVRPVVAEVVASDDRKTLTAALLEVDEVYMRDILDQEIEWQRYRKRETKWVSADAPAEVGRRVLNRVGKWHFPSIAGIITTPTLRPDGTVLCEAGYDPATRLLLVNPPALPAAPDQPSFEDAIEALNTLDELLDEFPFVDDASRSVALSAILTTVARGAFAAVPMHAVRSPTAGSGKSFLWDLTAAIAIGQPCPIISTGGSEQEMERRLAAAVVSGYPILSIDNVGGELGGDFLCQVIERPTINPRILGLSKLVQVPNRISTFATGNNMRLVGDMTRRVLLSSLNANVERPELRNFNADPMERVLADRGKYIGAALAVVRAYIVCGRPGKLSPLASFKRWSDTVRSALVWLGQADPVETIAVARAEDPELQALVAVLQAWAETIGCGPERAHTAGQIVTKANEKLARFDDNGCQIGWLDDYVRPSLREAIQGIGAVGPTAANVLGKWLATCQGRLVGKHTLASWKKGSHPRHWYISEEKIP